MILAYYTTDDGIWLECEQCGERICLGWLATVADAGKAEERHMEEKHP